MWIRIGLEINLINAQLPATFYTLVQVLLHGITKRNQRWKRAHIQHSYDNEEDCRAYQRPMTSTTSICNCFSNTVIAASATRNRQIDIASQMCRESVAVDIIRVHHIKSE